MLTLGKLETEDYLCVKTEKQGRPKIFDTADRTRAHWVTCHGIPVTEVVSPSSFQLQLGRLLTRAEGERGMMLTMSGAPVPDPTNK